ncbi:NAD(P)-binding protein [Aspergillus ellipticus CBS 707.79]|uniref:NAD(P)-binding protein n=1 Tax=Aspergillus ellipticus CBS 707.79 TaxID=1448320 RepID=A0A319EC31_9EURO|nr:NAD(P)-binding protein [Aspergillus ellipticus CBS 707.79]
MAPTILIIGATGNTGRSVTETLPSLLQSTNALPEHHRVIALTRSSASPVAQQLAKIPGIELIEKNWVDITSGWLREHQVVRAFIASHNEPNQFAEESAFYVAALNAGVQYVVRIATTAANALLSSPEFAALQWTSLQPNIFSQYYLSSAAEWINQYRHRKLEEYGGSSSVEPLKLLASGDAPVAIVDSSDVGVFAAHLLSQRDPAVHNKASYVLNGPEDITDRQIVDMVEQRIGARVEGEQVSFQDVSLVDSLLHEHNHGANHASKSVILSLKYALETAWEGKCSASTTSQKVLEIAPPRRTPAEVLETLLKDSKIGV